ncbi:hypothetical protein HPB51_022916 [Rhipicephalus microplus]|uniref:Uncharacterized protein n=1 Tax=Rhipicephalus microplus TaxID=6941 RepID=A0A9J6ECL4_RHIMP|nr:hypothetical protein HPB51_022916 [Rhipicephalus microplus]
MEPDVFFGKKPFCRLREALKAAANIAQNADDNVDVVVIPPEPSEETDKEEGDDDCMGSAPVKNVSERHNYVSKQVARSMRKRNPALTVREEPRFTARDGVRLKPDVVVESGDQVMRYGFAPTKKKAKKKAPASTASSFPPEPEDHVSSSTVFMIEELRGESPTTKAAKICRQRRKICDQASTNLKL